MTDSWELQSLVKPEQIQTCSLNDYVVEEQTTLHYHQYLFIKDGQIVGEIEAAEHLALLTWVLLGMRQRAENAACIVKPLYLSPTLQVTYPEKLVFAEFLARSISELAAIEEIGPKRLSYLPGKSVGELTLPIVLGRRYVGLTEFEEQRNDYGAVWPPCFRVFVGAKTGVSSHVQLGKVIR